MANTSRLTRRDLEGFTKDLEEYLAANGRDTSMCDADVVAGLWEILREDLPRYVHQKGWVRIRAYTAESGADWDETHQPDKAYLRVEGIAFERRSLTGLPLENTAWDYWFFGCNERVWNLFRMWVYYLQEEEK